MKRNTFLDKVQRRYGKPESLCCGFWYIPTQFKATQLVVAMAVWAIPGGLSITYRFYCVFNLSILLLNASEKYYITIG